MTAIAVNVLEIEPIRKTVCSVTGVLCALSETPEPPEELQPIRSNDRDGQPGRRMLVQNLVDD